MKAKLLFISLFLSITAFGQLPVLTKSYLDFQLKQKNKEASKKDYLTYSNVEGSPYLNKNFTKGEVLTKNNIRYVGIPLRYNAYKDVMEFRDSKGRAVDLQLPSGLKEIKIGHDIFVYDLYVQSDGKTGARYFKVVATGKVRGLEAYDAKFEEAQPAKPYQNPTPAKFILENPRRYVSINNKPAVKVQNINKLIDLLGNHKKELKSYVKKNKIKLRKSNDFTRLIYYYNSLK